jgi:Arc/MetJ-type ribon-helix-helix transcriptional regulator
MLRPTMSNRHAVRARKIPVSITLSPDDYDFIEMLINSRRYANRTHVIERAIVLLRQEFERHQAYLAQQGNAQFPPQGHQPPSGNLGQQRR